MRSKKSLIILSVLMFSAFFVLWQFALAKPRPKTGNPGLPGCLAEVAAKDAEIEQLNEQLDELRSQPPAPVPKTGQATSYAPDDDGDLETGVPWPNPRFTINGDTVTDNLTGLMWLQNANCIATNHPEFDNDGDSDDGRVTWQHALDFVAGVNDGTYSDCGAGYTDWQLPNIKQLLSLINYGFSFPCLSNTLGTGQLTDGDPFTNVVVEAGSEDASAYWSSTSDANGPIGDAWRLEWVLGEVRRSSKAVSYPVWPVRGGN